jgi:hypothetical protein
MAISPSSPPPGGAGPAAPPGGAGRAAPPLPDGWRYCEELDWEDERRHSARRRLVLWVLLGVAVVVLAFALLLVNAQQHYARGVAALESESYGEAVSELSSAKVLVIPYRDASVLAEQAERAFTVSVADAKDAQARLEEVSAALGEATEAVGAGSVQGVLTALRAVGAADLRAVLRADAGTAQSAHALAKDLTTEGRKALRSLEWERAARSASALLVLDASSAVGQSIAEDAAAGKKVSARLAEAKAAARDGEWRKALRLALAVLAAHKGFPGAQAVVADAREALKPKPRPAATQTVTTPATSTGGTTSGGSGSSGGSGGSSGGSSGPAPP